ncbi:MAG TPA: YdeI/OmpD-associated family protein [Thermoplasmata archaeon]
MPDLAFAATIKRRGPGTWSYVDVPRSDSAKLGTRARVAVRGTVNDVPVRTSLFPTGTGAFTMVVNAEVRAAANAEEGDPVTVRLALDTASRTVRTPNDLGKTLRTSAKGRAYWDQLSFSHRKEYVGWLAGTKNPETRARRVRAAIRRLSDGQPLSDSLGPGAGAASSSYRFPRRGVRGNVIVR